MSKAGKKRYRHLRAVVSEAINRADPMGLLGFGSPADEYDPEVGTVLPRLGSASSSEDVAVILHEEFGRWFGADQAGGRERYDRAAREIWNALEPSDHA